ncbi:hypothetical protein JCGZ_08902 [Jatropha curcas]|uniref:Uncharacterized protein n=1 Tax=Jatropha curcas TaxID=180498 RepID=A0A067KXD8_JATCU|nr:hypothetical protein JCGZ_08902 [Jatropha curcas]
MPPRYKRSQLASSVAARQRPIARPSTASPPPVPPPATPAPPPFEIGSPKQQERYTKLSLRPILPNRFIDENALAQVGLRDAVLEPLRRIGWEQFINMQDLVYAPLTLEFLSSYSSFIRLFNFPSKIEFRLFGRNYELSVNENSCGTQLFIQEQLGDVTVNPRTAGCPTVHPRTAASCNCSSRNSWVTQLLAG